MSQTQPEWGCRAAPLCVGMPVLPALQSSYSSPHGLAGPQRAKTETWYWLREKDGHGMVAESCETWSETPLDEQTGIRVIFIKWNK